MTTLRVFKFDRGLRVKDRLNARAFLDPMDSSRLQRGCSYLVLCVVVLDTHWHHFRSPGAPEKGQNFYPPFKHQFSKSRPTCDRRLHACRTSGMRVCAMYPNPQSTIKWDCCPLFRNCKLKYGGFLFKRNVLRFVSTLGFRA